MASGKKSASAARKARRKKSWERCNMEGGKKDKNVEKSSHGKFKSRKEMYAASGGKGHPQSPKNNRG